MHLKVVLYNQNIVSLFKALLLLNLIFAFSVGIVSISNFTFVEKVSEKIMLDSTLACEDLEIGTFKHGEERVKKVLGYDSYIYRKYTTQSGSFSLLILHWFAGNSRPRMASQHNPDICWVSTGGWKNLDGRKMAEALIEFEPLKSTKKTISFSPIEYLYLENLSTKSKYHVYFWQVSGGVFKKIGRDYLSNVFGYLSSLKDRISQVSKPTYFVRIHSTVQFMPIEGVELSKETGCKPQNYLIDDPNVRSLLQDVDNLTRNANN